MPSGGGETEKDPSGWSVDTLRYHMERRLLDLMKANDERDLRYEQRFAAQQDAIEKTEAANADRFAAVNEFRAQLADQAREFMGRNESIQRHDANSEKIGALDKRLTESLTTINSRLDLASGRGAGLEKGWGYLVGVVGIAIAIAAVAVALSR